MIISSFLCFLILLSLFGYSFLYKRILNKNTKFLIYNSDVFYGILLIIFFALFINFLFPLKFFTLPIVTIGLLIFLFGFKNKIFQIKFSYYFYIIFLINFFIYYNGSNVDSPLYHLQTLNWMILNKINLGIANLNIRFGVNSSWHSFIALMNISFSNISLKYYLSSIIFAILSYEIFFKKKFETEDIFLFLSVSFILTFALLHPFVNGPILNHLGNPEVDTVAMFLFIFSFYYFIKLYDNNSTDLNSSINIFVVIIFLAVTTKLSNISLIFLLLVIIYSNKNYKIINISNILVGITGLFWLFRSFLISGCFIFPIKTTCMKIQWSDLEQTEFIAKVIQSYTRDTRLRAKWTDFDYTINSYDWFIPWFNDYFLNTSLLKISGTLTILACLFLLILLFSKILKINNKKEFDRKYFIIVLAFFLISNYIWHKAPEIRFGSGLIISIPCFLLAIITSKLKIKKYFTHYKTFITIMLLFICVSLKHFQKFDIKHLILINKGNTKYEYIEKIADINGIEIFQSLISKCGDFPKICVNKKKEDYKITNKYGYRIFLK